MTPLDSPNPEKVVGTLLDDLGLDFGGPEVARAGGSQLAFPEAQALGKATATMTLPEETTARAVDVLKATAPLPPSWAMITGVPDHPFRKYCPHIERMSAQGMEIVHIAHRLNMSVQTLTEAMQMYPDVLAAVMGGEARGVDETTEMLAHGVRRGDIGAINTRLKMSGYNRGGDAGAKVTVNIGGAEAAKAPQAVTQVEDLAARQRRLPGRVQGPPKTSEAQAGTPTGTRPGPQAGAGVVIDQGEA